MSWKGERRRHSLASRGIRTTARGENEVKMYPHSYETLTWPTVKIVFKDKSNPDVEDNFIVSMDALVDKLVKYCKNKGMGIPDEKGGNRWIEPGDIYMLMHTQPQIISQLIRESYGKPIYHWQGITQVIPTTEYYPSIIGREVGIDIPSDGPFGTDMVVGTVIGEEITENSMGPTTLYKVEVDGKVYDITGFNSLKGKLADVKPVMKVQTPKLGGEL